MKRAVLDLEVVSLFPLPDECKVMVELADFTEKQVVKQDAAISAGAVTIADRIIGGGNLEGAHTLSFRPMEAWGMVHKRLTQLILSNPVTLRLFGP